MVMSGASQMCQKTVGFGELPRGGSHAIESSLDRIRHCCSASAVAEDYSEQAGSTMKIGDVIDLERESFHAGRAKLSGALPVVVARIQDDEIGMSAEDHLDVRAKSRAHVRYEAS